MKKILPSIVGILLLTSQVGFSTEVRFLKMNAYLHYQDDSGVCKSLRSEGQFLFTAEIEGQYVIRAVVANHPNEFPFDAIYKSFEIKSQPASPIEMVRDGQGRAWIKRWLLTEQQLSWLLYHPQRDGTCSPPAVATVEPKSAVFTFDTGEIDEGFLLSYSQKVSLTGVRADGRRYKATLRLVQNEPWYSPWDLK